MTRTIFLIVISFVLIAAGSLNAFEVKFTPQSGSTDYKAPVTSKMPAVEPADKIIVKEPLKIPDEVMTKPLPTYQPEPFAPADEGGVEQEFVQETADSQGVGAATGEESATATPVGQLLPSGPSQAIPVPQTLATQPAGAMPSGPVPAGGCGKKPILAGVILESSQENIEGQGADATGEEYQQENMPPEYYYEEPPATQTRPPGIYFHDEEKPQENPEGEVEE